MTSTLFRFFGRLRIRFYLTVLVLSCLVPVCLSSAYLLYYSYWNKAALLEQNLMAAANILSVALDRDLSIIQAALETLATSPALASGDMSTFHAQAREVLKYFPDSDIILADESGQQLVNSYKPYGSLLPKRNPQTTVRRIFDTGLPVISNLFRGAVTGRYLIGIDVPVFLDGKVRYDLAMTLPADRLSALLHTPSLPREWLIDILDNNHIIVARSAMQEAFIGRPVESRPLLEIMAAQKKGTTEGVNKEGVLSVISFQRSDANEWTVLVSAPKAVLAGELRQWLYWTAACLGALLTFGIGLATGTARIIARSVQNLVEPALALGRGEPLSLGKFELAETHEVANALLRAEALLREHETMEQVLRKGEEEATARANAAEELAVIVESSDDAIISNTAEGLITSWNRAAQRIFGHSAEEAVGRPISMLMPEDGEEQPGESSEKTSSSEGGHHYEARRKRRDGRVIDVSVCVSPIRDAGGRVLGTSTIARDITERKRAESEREKLVRKLREALANVKTLSGLLPICSYCKKIRNDKGYWEQLEAYFHHHSEAEFSHSICPDCYEKVSANLRKEYEKYGIDK